MQKSFNKLSDEQWEKIVILMDWQPPKERGRPRNNLRKIWNSIFYILTRGVAWKDIPTGDDYVPKSTAHRWLQTWQDQGVFDRVLSGLMQEALQKGLVDINPVAVDGSFSPALLGGEEVKVGHKGKGMLIHLLVDATGNPLSVRSTAANGNERTQVLPLLNDILSLKHKLQKPMMALEADKGYDSQNLRNALLENNIFPVIPWRKIKRKDFDPPQMKDLYEHFSIKRLRWQVERSFACLKQRCRRIRIRWERRHENWKAFLTLTLIHWWVPRLMG